MRIAKIALGLLALAVMVAGGARTADALSCDEPRPFLSPADGAQVPSDPVLYIFDPLGRPRPEVKVAGKPGRYQMEPVGENGAFTVYALKVSAPPGSETLEVALRPGASYRYRIDPDWHRPEEKEPRWVKVADRRRADWVATGSSHLAAKAPVAAPAYRVEIAPEPGAEGETVIVPGLGEENSWIYLDRPGVCEGLFAPARPGDWIRVGALLEDGSASELTEPVLLEDSGWGDRAKALVLLFAAALLIAGILFSSERR